MKIGIEVKVGIEIELENIGGYMKWKIWIEERIKYYIGIKVMEVEWIEWMEKWNKVMKRGIIMVGEIMMKIGMEI